jgi:hypothetical protein
MAASANLLAKFLIRPKKAKADPPKEKTVPSPTK